MFKNIFNKKESQEEEPRDYERRHSLSQSLIESFSGMKIKPNIEVANLNMIDKSSYKKQQYCTVCFRTFSTTFRQHHCRVCANAVCSECCGGRINGQKVCDICYLTYSKPGDQIKKQKILETLQTLCAYLIHKRSIKMKELQQLKSQVEPANNADQEKERQNQEQTLKQLEAEAATLADKKRELQESLASVVEHNRKLQQKLQQMDE